MRKRGGLIDRTVLVAANGDSLEIHGVNKRYTLTEEAYGMPPIEYVTQRGIFQDGESVLDNFLRPRPVQLVVRWSACSRAEYWNNRNTLLELVRPNRGGSTAPMRIRKYLANGKIRQLDVVPDSTPAFGPRDLSTWDEFAFSEALKFMAYAPTWYDPTQKSSSAVSGSPTSLSHFTEDWSSGTLNPAKWINRSDVGTTVTPGSGHVIMTAPPGSLIAVIDNPEFGSPSRYTILDSYWIFSIETMPTPNPNLFVASTVFVTPPVAGTNWRWWAWWIYSDSYPDPPVLHIQVADLSVDSAIYSTPYDPTAHKFLAGVHSADGIRWYASPDGVTWTLLASDLVRRTAPSTLAAYEMQFSSDDAYVTYGPVNLATPPSIVSGFGKTAVCNYAGTWKEFPIIRVSGPVVDPVITNSTTGESLSFAGLTVNDGETLIIDLTYGNKSAKIGTTNELGYLTADSDLASFHLAPAPEAAGGVNSIALSGGSIAAHTALEVLWYDRFVGI